MMKQNKHDKSERKQVRMILSVFGILFAMIAGTYLYCYQSEKNAQEYLDIAVSDNKVTNVSYVQMIDDSIEKVNISWQSNSDGDGKYLFLPSFAECDDVKLRLYAVKDAESEVVFRKKDEEESMKITTGQEGVLWKNLGSGNFVIDVNGTETEFTICQSANMPSIWLDIEHAEGLSYIESDKEHVSAAEVTVLTAVGQMDYSGRVEQFKGHGNSTWERPKRSYKMYLQQKNSLLGMDKCKKWVLLSNVMDDSMMRNKLFTDMAKSCGLENTMDNAWVDLYVDGEYRGLYLLSEKIDINSENFDIGDLEKETKALNEEEMDTHNVYQMENGEFFVQGWMIPNEPSNNTGGYLLELDYRRRYKGEASKFHTLSDQYVVVKSPEYATVNQIGYISGFVQGFENAILSEDGKNDFGLHYTQYIDVESFAKKYVLDEISKNIDSGYSSSYFYKPKDDMKMYAGPIWDYDTALGNNQYWGKTEQFENPNGFYANAHGWSEALYAQPEFYEQALYEYGKYFEPYIRKADRIIDDYMKEIEAAADMNNVMWSKTDWRNDVEEMEQFLEQRRLFLNSEWKK